MVRITTGRRDRVDSACQLLGSAFNDDPAITFCLASLDEDDRDRLRGSFIGVLLHGAVSKNATIEEVEDFSSCGVIVPPAGEVEAPATESGPNFMDRMKALGLEGCMGEISHLSAKTKQFKENIFNEGDKYFYIFFLGTAQNGRGRGLCSAIVGHYQDLARVANLPIYLEAGSEQPARLYRKLGFTDVGEIHVAQGLAGTDGRLAANGPGFKMWGMVWRPEQTSK